MPTTIPNAIRADIEGGYEAYLASPRSCKSHEVYPPLRDTTKQTFADAMCEGSIVEGLDNGQAILEVIKNSGRQCN